MKFSPVQLLQVAFTRVRVEIDAAHAPAEPLNPFTHVFVFDGVNIATEFSFGEVDPDHERGQLYRVNLQVVVDNVPLPEQTGQTFSPYQIDIEVGGVVAIPRGAEQLGPPQDLASVNGASLLWSAIREQVLTLTSRMSAGPAMLPTVHFHDLKKGPPPAAPDTTPKRRTRASVKAPASDIQS
jgi:preprotein translocase subunit SecB